MRVCACLAIVCTSRRGSYTFSLSMGSNPKVPNHVRKNDFSQLTFTFANSVQNTAAGVEFFGGLSMEFWHNCVATSTLSLQVF